MKLPKFMVDTKEILDSDKTLEALGAEILFKALIAREGGEPSEAVKKEYLEKVMILQGERIGIDLRKKFPLENLE